MTGGPRRTRPRLLLGASRSYKESFEEPANDNKILSLPHQNNMYNNTSLLGIL